MFHKQNVQGMSRQQLDFLKKLHMRKYMIRCTQWFILIFVFALWEIAARESWIDPFIFSQPSRMFSAMIDMIKNGTLWLHIGVTLWETIVGFMLGTVLGILLAILLWWNHFISDVTEPYLVVLNSLPKTALAPIIIVWLGNNMSSIISFTIISLNLKVFFTLFLYVELNRR